MLHNLSDADFILTGPAVSTAELLLKTLAPEFGYDPSATARYNDAYRNVALSLPLRGAAVHSVRERWVAAVRAELHKLRVRGLL